MKEKILTLSLKTRWFQMIKSGVKTEEYREMTFYWDNRFIEITKIPNGFKYGDFKKFDKIVFTLGYPKADDTSRRIEFQNPRFKIATGRPEWGAEPGKQYFVITWDK